MIEKRNGSIRKIILLTLCDVVPDDRSEVKIDLEDIEELLINFVRTPPISC